MSKDNNNQNKFQSNNRNEDKGGKQTRKHSKILSSMFKTMLFHAYKSVFCKEVLNKNLYV